MAVRITLKVKLISAFLVTTMVVVLLSVFNVGAIQGVRESLTDLVDSHLPRLSLLQTMRVTATRLDKATTQYEFGRLESQKNALLADIDKLNDQEKDYLVLIDKMAGAESDEALNAFKPVSTAKAKTINTIFELIALNEQRAPASVIAAKEDELAVYETTFQSTLNTAIEQDLAAIDQENLLSNASAQQVTFMAILGSIMAGIFAIMVGLVLSISVARNVKKLRDGSVRLASGDFSSKIAVTSHDELGQLAESFNQMSASLRASYLRLALEKERDETLLESMSEGMVALDEKGNIVLINSVALNMLGLELEKATGQPFSSLVTLNNQDDKPVAPESLPTTTLTTGQPIDSVFSYRSDGHKVLLSIASNPVKLEGRVAGAIIVLRDVTKEREVDRMKTEFISLASHQLRTPLSAIKWFSEMLLNGDAGKLKPEQLDFTKNIADSTDRMVALVNSLLNISRIESGRIIVDPRPTDLKELITGIVNDLKAKTEERQQTLIISVHSDLPKINLDPRLIGQVYLNLLTNAIKYTPKKGEISVLISKKGEDIISQVTDNGYGIPKAQQGRMFQKFFRAENVAKVETDGTGLGLYLIKAIVESSGGKIWFESEENKGTTFWFTIPVSGMKAKEGEVTLDA